MNLKALFPFFKKSAPGDGGWRILGSTIPASYPQNWWQLDLNPKSHITNSAVEACVGIYARTIAMLPVKHIREIPEGGREPVKNSYITKLLKHPNHYQTRADFFLNLVRSELFTGNGYAVAMRFDDYKVHSLHLVPSDSSRHYIDKASKEIYYHIKGNKLIDDDVMVPARDILHVRMQTGNDLLQGETPLQSGVLAASAGTAIQGHNASFFNNMSRPSGTLDTDKELTKDQARELRERWNTYSKGLNSGGTPILSHGLKWNPLTMTAADAATIDAYKLTVADIARVFGVPLALIGALDDATLNNVETLLRQWISMGLGYMVEHLELALDHLFDLPDNESIAFDIDHLLRGDMVARIEALSKGVISGIYSPNEARNKEGLRNANYGDEPRVQQQVVPLSWWQEQSNSNDQQVPFTDKSQYIHEQIQKAMV